MATNWGQLVGGMALGGLGGYGVGLRESGQAMREAALAQLERDHDFALLDRRAEIDRASDERGYKQQSQRDETLHGYDLERDERGHENDLEREDRAFANDKTLLGMRQDFDATENRLDRAHDMTMARLEAALDMAGGGSGGGYTAEQGREIDAIVAAATTTDIDGNEVVDPQVVAQGLRARGYGDLATVYEAMPVQFDPEIWSKAETMVEDEAYDRRDGWFSKGTGFPEGMSEAEWKTQRVLAVYNDLLRGGGGMLPDTEPGTAVADEGEDNRAGSDSEQETGERDYPPAPVDAAQRRPGQIYEHQGKFYRWVVDERSPNGAWEPVE